ncbi:zinc finger MYM-type protein 1-like, partial [Aphis craccivora]
APAEIEIECLSTSPTSKSVVEDSQLNPPNDVANFCRKSLNDNEKYELIVKAWVPDITYKFPTSSKWKLKFQHSWLRSFPWLTYSAIEDGAYCRICVSFSQKNAGKGNHENLKAFIQTSFRSWKKALEKFKEHQNKLYHKDAIEDAHNFRLIFENKRNDVITEIDKGRKQQQLENRRKLTPIIRAILLCGRQGLALRGNRDYGPLLMKVSKENDGNFRAFLRYAIECGDIDLHQHLQTASINATYLSPRIQNEIIDAAGKIITNKIVERINKAKCFASIADETIDVSGIEQFSVCVRYVDEIEGEYVTREDFLCFVPVEIVTGEGLANTLLTTLNALGVNTLFMKGQGYDGARAMSGQYNGCAAIIKKICPEAVYVHCANHNLNLAITHACKITPIRNCLGTIKEIVNYFRKSNKAGLILKNKIKADVPEAKQTRLLKFCETRWVEHLNSLSLFYDVFEYICSALEELEVTTCKVDGVQPHTLLLSICTPQFIVALLVLKPIFSLTKNLSLSLQKVDCDLSSCVQYSNNLYEEINQMRENAESNFKNVFKQAMEMAEKTGAQMIIPRRVKNQIHRENYAGNPEAYYRKSIFIPFLDHYLDQLSSRFLDHSTLLLKIQNILPSKCIALDTDGIKETAHTLITEWPNEILGTSEDLIAEIVMWR